MGGQGRAALVGPVGQLHHIAHLIILGRGLDDAETLGVEEERMTAEHGLELGRSGMVLRDRLAIHALLDTLDLSGRQFHVAPPTVGRQPQAAPETRKTPRAPMLAAGPATCGGPIARPRSLP